VDTSFCGPFVGQEIVDVSPIQCTSPALDGPSLEDECSSFANPFLEQYFLVIGYDDLGIEATAFDAFATEKLVSFLMRAVLSGQHDFSLIDDIFDRLSATSEGCQACCDPVALRRDSVFSDGSPRMLHFCNFVCVALAHFCQPQALS